ncbi:hypothetical protein OH77DRAFT_666284 [Trametes cingulata]|nr:hypothetical protein OH77DRAFT_666284 [Trametes cingulata]
MECQGDCEACVLVRRECFRGSGCVRVLGGRKDWARGAETRRHTLLVGGANLAYAILHLLDAFLATFELCAPETRGVCGGGACLVGWGHVSISVRSGVLASE